MFQILFLSTVENIHSIITYSAESISLMSCHFEKS